MHVRKFSGRDAGTLRPDRKEQRQQDAQRRQAEYDLLTAKEKEAKDKSWHRRA